MSKEFDEKYLSLNINAASWEQAIEEASKPLLENKNITHNYVQAMIDSVKKLGPYIVIAPGLALGHARPSKEVLKTGFSIATLQKPVKFGNEANDPVDIVVILASVNSTDHLHLLQHIVAFLNEKSNLTLLRHAENDDDAKTIANSINGGE